MVGNASSVLKGRKAWGRGGEIPRACHRADAEMLDADADLLRTGPSGMQLQEASIGVRTTLVWIRAVRAPSASRAAPRRSLEALLRGRLRRCPSGCFLRAGYTCRTCIPRGCHALKRRVNRGSRATVRKATNVRKVGQFVGEIVRLGRHWQLRPEGARRPTWVTTLKFVGLSGGLGRVRLITGVALS
jgi:hypothetical protein